MIYHLEEIEPTESERLGRLPTPHRRGTAAPNAQAVKEFNDNSKRIAEQKKQNI